MKIKGKITAILLMIVILIGVAYLSLFASNETKNVIGLINIEGNNYLTREQYMNFAKLNKISDYKFLSLPIIKDRLEKHPFIERADVKFAEKNEVLVSLKEKNFEAVLLSGDQEFLISDKFEVVPISMFKNMDLPVIVNPLINRKIKRFAKLKTDETITAFKIIETAKLVNHDLYSSLSEINLRSGKDIILSFKGLDFPVVIGRGNEISKILYFNEFWNKLNNLQSSDLPIEYVDLRFNKLVNVGITDSIEGSRGI